MMTCKRLLHSLSVKVTVLSSRPTNLNMKFIPVAIAKGPNYVVQLVTAWPQTVPLSCSVHAVLSSKF